MMYQAVSPQKTWHLIKCRLFRQSVAMIYFQGVATATSVVCDSAYKGAHLGNMDWYDTKISAAWDALNEDFAPADHCQIEKTKINIGLQTADHYLIHLGSDLPRKNRVQTCFGQLFFS